MDVLIIHPFADRQVMLIAALIISVVFFGPLALYRGLGLERPERWAHHFIIRTEQKLNRSKRSAGTRVYRGMIMLIFMSFLGLLFSLLVYLFVKNWAPAEYLELFLLAYLIPVRHMWDLSRSVSKPLANNQEATARQTALVMTYRNAANDDTHATVRISIEHLMQKLSDSVIAPALWYLALGLPAVILVRLVGALDSHVGYRSQRFAMFGWSIARLDDLLQWLPARICGMLICIATFFIPRCKPFHALGIMLFHRNRILSPNRKWPIAATAGALNISLAGPRKLRDDVIQDDWVGKGSAKATVHDLVRGQWLYVATFLLFLLLLATSLMVPQDLTFDELLSINFDSIIGIEKK